MSLIYKKARITYALALICIIAYMALPQALFYRLSLYAPAVRAGEWWRVVSAMFLHLNIEHLMSNMLSLVLVGAYVEAMYGKKGYLAIYLCSGVAGGLLTYLVDTVSGRNVYSVGASGAIAGLVGAFIAYIVVARLMGAATRLPTSNIFLAAIVVTVPGLTETGVNAMGHIGGFVGGVAAGAVIAYVQTLRKTLV